MSTKVAPAGAVTAAGGGGNQADPGDGEDLCAGVAQEGPPGAAAPAALGRYVRRLPGFWNGVLRQLHTVPGEPNNAALSTCGSRGEASV